ncbi:hypothetical protein ACHAQH_009560 [Verticillium albo-atrum]
MAPQHLLVGLVATHALLVNASSCPVGTPSWVTVHPEVTSMAQDRAVREYWTPERIANIDSAKLIPNAPPIPQEVQHLGQEFPGKGAIVSTVGRLLYTSNSAENTTADSSCTATLVESANGATIITAGHCVHAGGGNPMYHGYHDNLLFIPGWKDGKRPYDSFTANHVVVPKDWVEGETYEDKAFVILNAGDDGRAPGKILGKGQHMRFDSDDGVGDQRWLLGYTRYHSGPAGLPQQGTPAFTGRRLSSCNGTAFAWRFGNGLSGVECRMSGGASGGPHFEGLDLKTGRGTIVAVNNIVDVVGDDNLPAMFGVNVTDARTESLLKVAGSIDISY